MINIIFYLLLPLAVSSCITTGNVEDNNVSRQFCPACIITYRGPPFGRSLASVSTRTVTVSPTLCRLFITCPAGSRAIGIMNNDPNQSVSIQEQLLNCEQEVAAVVTTTTGITAAATTTTGVTVTMATLSPGVTLAPGVITTSVPVTGATISVPTSAAPPVTVAPPTASTSFSTSGTASPVPITTAPNTSIPPVTGAPPVTLAPTATVAGTTLAPTIATTAPNTSIPPVTGAPPVTLAPTTTVAGTTLAPTIATTLVSAPAVGVSVVATIPTPATIGSVAPVATTTMSVNYYYSLDDGTLFTGFSCV